MGRANRKPAGQKKAQRHHGDAGEHERQRADIASKNARSGRQNSLNQSYRQENHTCHQRRIAQTVLHVKRQQITAAEHADAEDNQHEHRDAEMTVAQQADVEQRMVRP